MDSFLTPTGRQRFEIGIKRSRFISTFDHVTDRASAREFVDSLRSEFPDANHHCWAMIAGRPDDMFCQDQSDDGEPRGTAGKPMLNVLQHSGLGEIAVVVTRYFGGIKLGAGGLVRAYTQSVSDAVPVLATRQAFIRDQIKIELPYASLDSLEHWLKNTNIAIESKAFSDKVELTLLTPASERELLEQKVQELGYGQKLTNDKKHS